MQLMTWTMSRLGSRFNLLLEPYQRRVMHSALGRFLDAPLDLMVGMVDPDGVERVLPFTTRGVTLHNCEQFDRVNSITYRGYSEKYRLRFEFNIHSVFYPQDERLCTMPAFYLEMRANPVARVRWEPQQQPQPKSVTLFIRLRRPDTAIRAAVEDDRAAIDLTYENSLTPRMTYTHETKADAPGERRVQVAERIVSLNQGCTASPEGDGLMLDIPVSPTGSGIKWRLVWGAFCGDPVLDVAPPDQPDDPRIARFRYLRDWSSLDQVIHDAIHDRDENLAYSRRFEKVIEQTPMGQSQRHLINQSFQNWLSNTFWCDVEPRQFKGGVYDKTALEPWFSVWEGNCLFHSTIDVEYNVALIYLTLWPQLLAMQFDQWAVHVTEHEKSGGVYLSHDMGSATRVTGQAYPHPMEVEENSNYLLLLQAYAHWTGDLAIVRRHGDLIDRLAKYLLWTDTDRSGFPSEGVANTIDDASPATQYARKQTYLAVKRIAALRAAVDLLSRCGRGDEATAAYERRYEADLRMVELNAWLGDHYAVCVDRSAVGMTDVWTGKPLTSDTIEGWDAVSIYTGNALLLPTMIGQPPLLNTDRLINDMMAGYRECMSRYGCGHTSFEPENVWVSQNLWRDLLARYMGMAGPTYAQLYWDLQVMSNTHDVSKGFIDTYINNNLCFYPRGIASIGYVLAHPRLIIDRLAPGGAYITVEPDRNHRQRWPLLPLADWKAGKIPVCVVDPTGNVTIEGAIDPVIIHGQQPKRETELIG
jgi:hypothetical protein